jgi:hypothetical protein
MKVHIEILRVHIVGQTLFGMDDLCFTFSSYEAHVFVHIFPCSTEEKDIQSQDRMEQAVQRIKKLKSATR